MADRQPKDVDRQWSSFELSSTAPNAPEVFSKQNTDSDLSHVGGEESLEAPDDSETLPQIPNCGWNDPELSGVGPHDSVSPIVGPNDVNISSVEPNDPELSSAAGMNEPDFTRTGMSDPELSGLGLNDPKLPNLGGNNADFTSLGFNDPGASVPDQNDDDLLNPERADSEFRQQNGLELSSSRSDGPELSRPGWHDRGFPQTAWKVPGGSIAGQRNRDFSSAGRIGHRVSGTGMTIPDFLSAGPQNAQAGQRSTNLSSSRRNNPDGLQLGPGLSAPVIVTRGDASGPRQYSVLIRGPPEHVARRANVRGIPESGSRRMILSGIPGPRGGLIIRRAETPAPDFGPPIVRRDTPAPDIGPPIVRRDTPVSDTEPIVSSNGPASVQSRVGPSKIKIRLAVTIFLGVCVIFGAAFGTIYSQRNSDSQGEVGSNKPVSVKGAEFHGSFLLEDRWDSRMADNSNSAFHSLSQRLETVIDDIYSYSSVHARFSHSTVTRLSEHESNLILVTVVLKLKDHTPAPDELNLQAADLREAFLKGRLQLLNSQSVEPSRRNLAVKIITDSLSITAVTGILAKTTTTTMPPEITTGKLPDATCGEIRVLPDVRVVGGSESRRGVYPWLVMMLKNDRFECAGSILDHWTILTAAHCLKDEPKQDLTGMVDTRANDITIIAGKHESDTDTRYKQEQRISVKTGYMHLDFEIDVKIRNDIAVMRLSRPLQFNSRVAPLCLPAASSPLPPVCVVAGWGAVDFDNEDLPPMLRTATVQAYNSTACERVFQSTFSFQGHPIGYYLFPSIMCSANGTFGGINTCHGDSGGPLICLTNGADGEKRYTQFGIVSWGKWCGQPGTPDFYTYVPHFLSWLHTTALPALVRSTSSTDRNCLSFSPWTDNLFMRCRPPLIRLRYDSQCRNITEVVWCVLDALKKGGHECQPEDVYTTLVNSASLRFTSLQRRHCQERYQSSELTDPKCRTFSPTSTLFDVCQDKLLELRYDSQCRNTGKVVSCYVEVLEAYGHICRRKDVFATIVNSSELNLSPLQRRRCDSEGYRLTTSSLCHNLTAISSALTVCTSKTPCVSMLEATLCVHAVLDPNWQLCSREDLQSFISSHLNASLRICEDYTVRTMTDGRHFMYVNGDWFVLCGNHWTHTEAEVACRRRGFKAGKASHIHRTGENVYVSEHRNTSFDYLRYVKASGWMMVTCSGFESLLEECSLKRQITCSSSYLAASVCYNTAYEFKLIAAQPGSAYGYIRHIGDRGEGYVCVPDLSDRAAHLLCRGAGYVAGMVYTRGLPPPSGSTVWETEMQCGAGDVDVNGCTHGNWTLLPRPSGSCAPAQVYCFPKKARLHNGLFNSTGIVQVYQTAQNGHDVTLKTVCREGFNDVAAGILCRQMGFSGLSHSLQFNPFYKPNTEYVSVACTGKETELEDCGVHNRLLRTCAAPAVVKCYTSGNKEPDLSVRLSQPDNKVQVSVDGQWGTICTDHWTDHEAAALCRQLGHLYGYRRFAAFEAHPRRSVPHVLHNLRCGVNATSVQDCSHELVASDVCQHVRAAAVLCSNHSMPVYSLHNVNITVPNGGVVYVNYNGTSAPLRVSLSNKIASDLCQTLGYVTGESEFISSSKLHAQDRVLWWSGSSSWLCSDVQCLTASLRLINCSYGFQQRDGCGVSVASLLCYSSAARLTHRPGALQTTGIVQLYRNGMWWEVCHDDITQSAADVICHDIMGSSSASAILLRDVYRLGSYPTVKASVFCNPTDSGMTSSDCVVLDPSSKCESFNSDPASLVCYHGSRPSGAISSWKIDYSPYGSKVWAKRYGVWGTVCADSWSDDAASLLCRHLRYKSGSAVSTRLKRDATTPLWAWSVSCTFLATDFDSCQVNLTSVVPGRCFRDHDAEVECRHGDYY